MKKNKGKYKKPNFFVYGVFYIISKIISKLKFNLKIKRNEIKKAKGPYIVIANHESSIDFINLAASTKHRLSFVISNSFYNSLKVNPLLKACGVIPKQQFQTNASDMKKMKQVISNNGKLVVYPAGLMTENGVSTPIPVSTAKFLKWLDVDVYVAYTEGSYLTNPKWGKGFRKGEITLDIYKLFTKEQLAEYPLEELSKLIYDKLYYNAYKNQERNMIPYKNGNNIQGLQNVLYWCPKCNKEFTYEITSNNTMKCSHCGNEVYLDEYGFLKPQTENDIYYKHPSDWSENIYNNLYDEVSKNINYALETTCTFKMLNYKKHQFEEICKGSISLDKDKFTLNGDFNGENTLEVLIKSLPTLPFKPGVHLEIQDGNTIYRCCFDDGKLVTKWINLLKVFYELNNK